MNTKNKKVDYKEKKTFSGNEKSYKNHTIDALVKLLQQNKCDIPGFPCNILKDNKKNPEDVKKLDFHKQTKTNGF